MANRRFGGAPGPQRGGFNRNFGNASSNISPWQGGGGPAGNANNNNIQNQLALALTSLIQQTTKQQPSAGPPSLLNMNNSSPGFYNNRDSQFNNPNRFNNRGTQDFRPFNKNNAGGGQWRGNAPNRMVNKRGGGGNFGPKNQFNRNNKPGGGGGVKTGKVVKKAVTKPSAKPTVEKQEKESENGDEKEETTEETEGDETETKSTEKVKRTPKPSIYDGLPNGLLHCFVCNKTMWDGESFQNHLGGKAHKQMISSLEESFQITVNILRENLRLSEERKVIEHQRSQRRYRHKDMQPVNHCNMCDLKFMGKMALHRQTEGHHRLKRFLHPRCNRCNLEFPYRMEWVDHHFSKEHLFKFKEFLDTKNLAPDEYKVKIQAEIDIEPLLEETVHNEDDHPVLELNEDLNNLFNRIPVPRRNRAIAKQSLTPATGFTCNICKIFMTTEEESEAHLKTQSHYQKFVKAVKSKHNKALNEKKKAEAEAAAAENGEAKEGEVKDEEKAADDMYDPFAADEGNEKEEEEEEETKDDEEETKEEIVAEEVKVEKMEVAVEVKEEPVPVKEAVVAAPAAPVPATPNTRQKRAIASKTVPASKAKKAKN